MTAQELVRDLTQNSRSGRLSCDQADTLEAILTDYLERLERGETPDATALLAAHPDLVDELHENLAKLAALHRAAVAMTDGGETFDQLCLMNLTEHRRLGEFRLIRPIGRGGMGVVYEAEQSSLNRRVALKTLPLAAVLDPKQLTRFKNEAHAAASLNHPHIVSVYAVGSDRGVHYYTMQFVEGLSLAEVVEELRKSEDARVPKRSLDAGLSQTVTVPPQIFSTPKPTSSINTRPIAALSTLNTARPAEYFRSVARLGIQAAEALHYAHEMGVVHRDVKLSNLLLDNDGQLYVTDFGLAMTLSNSNLTMSGDLLGTLRYMSPEQACGHRALVDRRTDIYSLGASLYELATLQPAFPETDRARLLHQIATDLPPRRNQRDHAIPRDLDTVIFKAMAKELSSRYQTAKELADDLERFVKLEPVHARRITKIEYARSWCRRNKSVASLLAAVAVLLLVLSIGGPLAAIKQSRLRQLAQEEINAKNINQLYQDWYSGNVERVGAELRRHDATADATEFLFEWELLRNLYSESQQAILEKWPDDETRFRRFIECPADGRWLACGWPEHGVTIYDLTQKKSRLLENEPEGGPADVAFSHDGKELFTVSPTGVINRRDVATSQVVGPVIQCGVNDPVADQEESYARIQVSRDGRTAVVSAQNGESAFLVVVRLEDGKCTRIAAHDGVICAFALSPDGSTLISSGEDGLIKFWDLSGNQFPQTLPCSYAWDIQFTWDGQKLLICDYVQGVSIFDAASLVPLPGLRGEQQYVRKMAIYRDETIATVGNDDRILLWDLKTRKLLATLIGHEGNVADLAFSPDGNSLVSVAEDETLRLWLVGERFRETNDRAARFEWWRTDMQFSADGRKLISCARPNAAPAGLDVDTRMIEWDIATGEGETIVPQGRHGRCDLAVIPGTEHLLLCGGPGEFSLRDRSTGELVQLLDDDPLHEYQNVTVSLDGKWAAGSGHHLRRPRQTAYLASRPTGNECFVVICDLNTKQRQFFPLQSDTAFWFIRCIEFSPDGKFLVSAGGDSRKLCRVDILELRNDRFQLIDKVERRRGDTKYEAMKVDFSADSRLVGTVNQAGFARVWSLRGPKWEAPPLQRKNGLFSLAFSPDGRILALGDSSGIQLCHLQSQFTLASIPFGQQIRALEFSPDGRTLAWAAADGQLGFLRAYSVRSSSISSASSPRN